MFRQRTKYKRGYASKHEAQDEKFICRSIVCTRRVWEHGSDQQLKEKNTPEKLFFLFLWSKIAIYLSLGLQKNVPASGEDLNHQKRTKNEIY